MKRLLLVVALAVALPAAAQEMKPNKDPVPSPSDLRGARARPLHAGLVYFPFLNLEDRDA